MKKITLVLAFFICSGFTLQNNDGYLLELHQLDEFTLVNNNVTQTINHSATFTNSTNELACFDIVVVSVDEVYTTEHSEKNIKIPEKSTIILVENGIYQLLWLKNGDIKISDSTSGFLKVDCN